MALLINDLIVKQYKVSHPTITNWIKNAEKNGLLLGIERNKMKIIDSPANHDILSELAFKNRKYKNTRYENKYIGLNVSGLTRNQADLLLSNLENLRNRK
jgi:hypothetical protein